MKKWMVFIIIFIVVYPIAFAGFFLYGNRFGLELVLGKIPVLNDASKYDSQKYINFDRSNGEILSYYNRTNDVAQSVSLYNDYLLNNSWTYISHNRDQNGINYYYTQNVQNGKTYSLQIAFSSDTNVTEVIIKSS